MKHLEEYRDALTVRQYLDRIRNLVTGPWSVMEICGGQTHSLVKNGIVNLLPEEVTMVHGPGCPVCVTPESLIDQAIELAHRPDCLLCSFGDMLRVPGTKGSLLQAKANGANIQIVYSPLDALKIAQAQNDLKIIFFAVGFETTAPANALSVLQAEALGLDNYFLLASHVLVPPAMEALIEDEETRIDGFLAAGHVCTVMGESEYQQIVDSYKLPVVVTGFEPVDLLAGLYRCLELLEKKYSVLDNQYKRVVQKEGNRHAQSMINSVFQRSDKEWRGIGVLPDSGFILNEQYARFDAAKHFGLTVSKELRENGCIAGEILKGVKMPIQCPEFGKGCKPEHPIGAPMVSSEGACAAYFQYQEV